MYADDYVVNFEDGHIAEKLRQPGRPKGRRDNKNLGLAQLVSDLIYIADKVGGKLTCEKNIGQGNLIDAIDLLEPFLPPSVVQQDRSPSTIENMRFNCLQAVGRRSDSVCSENGRGTGCSDARLKRHSGLN